MRQTAQKSSRSPAAPTELFIETAFLQEDAALAAERRHLTARREAGMLAAKAGAARVVPFHFSPRYIGREDDLRREVEAAWRSG